MELDSACGNQLESFEIRFFTNSTISIGDIEYDIRLFHITQTVDRIYPG